mmetsp:Transcript_25409/g.83552  ORF Transcript_25409/g.83552 Transcript_25409/m.83552 type:complete len:202 (+) Transcript_25409:784-1389(+)
MSSWRRRMSASVMGKLPWRRGTLLTMRLLARYCGTPKYTTFPSESKPRRPARPLICRNWSELKCTESPANTTVLHGMLIPMASVSVEITTRRCLARKRISTTWRYFLGKPPWWTPMPRLSARISTPSESSPHRLFITSLSSEAGIASVLRQKLKSGSFSSSISSDAISASPIDSASSFLGFLSRAALAAFARFAASMSFDF